MTRDDALKHLSHIARERAFGRHAGSNRLIQAGLDALIAGGESPSLAMLAGLHRSEEPEAGEEYLVHPGFQSMLDVLVDAWLDPGLGLSACPAPGGLLPESESESESDESDKFMWSTT